ncbi:TetR/AcrR family transcriptional regulator [Nocardia sp. NBC_00511]|uniref:TetR/AcrR family transcriptional regulator n=1 Tax=Nocardia sp. NBC_00511 TaxID=2903591 RepID=UPI0030DFC6D4
MGRPPTNDDATRDRLISAATDQLRDRSPGRLSMREVATAAAASTTSIYTLFGSRDGLLAAVRGHVSAQLFEVLAAVPAGDDPLADLLAIASAYRRWALDERHFYAVIFGGGTTYTPSGTPSDQDPAAPLVDAISRVHASRYPTTEVNRIAVAVWATLHGFVTLELDGTLPSAYIDGVMSAAVKSLVIGWHAPASSRIESGELGR